MYKIYADSTLIYDSTLEDYKIVKGSVSLETNKSGSFTFSIYPDHFYYDNFVRMKTVIKVLKDNRIIFRGRVLNDTTDYRNNKVLTCEGELGFLQDSLIRPYTFSGTPADLLTKLVQDHNSQVDNFKKFKIGVITVVDPNNYIARSNSNYESAFINLNSRLIEDSLGGYFYITHGEDGSEDIPTLNYIADFTNVSSQIIEFGSNLRDFVKTVKADDIATVLIPLGATNEESQARLTVASVNGGKDYIEDADAIAIYGRIVKVETWDDVTVADNLLTKGKARLAELVKQHITLELSAVDLHLLDRSIESFKVGDYIRVVSAPHKFDSTLLCTKQTINLLKPDDDNVTLGYNRVSFAESTAKASNSAFVITTLKSNVNKVSETASQANTNASQALNDYKKISGEMSTLSGDIESVASAVTDLARSVSTNASNISANANNISNLSDRMDNAEKNISNNTSNISQLRTDVAQIKKDVETVAGEVAENYRTIKESLTDPLTEKNTSISDIIARLEALENPPENEGDNVETEGGGTE